MPSVFITQNPLNTSNFFQNTVLASSKINPKKEFEILVHFETHSGFTDKFLLFKLPENFKHFQDD